MQLYELREDIRLTGINPMEILSWFSPSESRHAECSAEADHQEKQPVIQPKNKQKYC